ncbi:MAG: hypothetical protein GXY44_14120 [Phycisphaerales bacterium]|nr:hypothetical protein [Phycisphaerales bacterium]
MVTNTVVSQEGSEPGVMVCRWRWEVLAIILALALQVIYFTGFVSSDDGNYVRLVYFLRDGQPIPEDLHYFIGRFVHWGALLLAVSVWPRHIQAIAVVPMLATLMTFPVIWAFARRYLNPRIAPLALFIFGLTPIVVINASVAVPDPLAMVFGWTGVYLAAGALLQRDTPRAGLRCLAAGLLIAVGYNAKESTMAMVPGLMLFVFLFRTRCLWAWKRAVFLGLGAGLWLAGEMIGMAVLYGNPFFHKHAITIAQRIGGPFAELTPVGLLLHWTDYLRWLLDPRGDYALMGPVLLAGIIHGFLARKDALRLLLCVIMPILLYLSFGSSEFGRYVPLAHQSRYLLPILPGMALLAADMVGRLWQRGPRTRRVTTVAAAIVLVTSLWAPNRLAGKWYYADVFQSGYRLLADHQADLRNQKLYAAQITWNRLFLAPHYLDIPELEVINPIPITGR